MHKKIVIGIILALMLAVFLTLVFISFQKHIFLSNKIPVTTSFYPLYFFASQIGGNKAAIVNITPSGAEPHDYEPTAQDMVRIEHSKLLILNGGGLEAWGENIKQNLDFKNIVIVTAGEGLINQQVVAEGKNITDPHIWLSPPLAKEMVDNIVQGFMQVDLANKEYYQSNANVVKIKLDDLDKQYKQGLRNCREKNIITSHAAFGHLTATYGLIQIPITGLSPDAEPSPQQLATIVEFAKDNNVKYIFFESLVSAKLSNTIAIEVGAKTLVLNPLEGLTNEEMSQGKNYFTQMQNNLANLKIALECK